jgi:tetratricopeptide (TPR) repeat protein
MPSDESGVPTRRRVSVEEAEVILVERIRVAQKALDDAVWNLVVLYNRTGQKEKARQYLEQLLTSAEDPGVRALYLLSLGQLLEGLDEFAGAIEAYTQALALEPTSREVWYLINNNLGYCLNHMGRHDEGETFCRRAIEIDPARHSAYKNLGIALEGLGQVAEAARCYRWAAAVCPSDTRAQERLEALLARHPAVAEHLDHEMGASRGGPAGEAGPSASPDETGNG